MFFGFNNGDLNCIVFKLNVSGDTVLLVLRAVQEQTEILRLEMLLDNTQYSR